MQDLARALWVARLWSTVLVLALGATTWALPWPAPVVGFGIAAAIEVAAAIATHQVVRGFRGDRGELMYTNGLRMPIATLRRLQRVEHLELIVTVGLAAAALVESAWFGARPAVGSVAIVLALLQVGIVVQRLYNKRLTEALLALHAQDPERALKLVRPLLRMAPAYRLPAETYEALAILQRGEVDDALARLEERWSGALDTSAVTIATLRMYRGDPGLADRWLAAEHADDRYHRYLVALVRGTRHLLAGEPDPAIAAVRPAVGDVPPYYARELHMVEAAALQLAGRTEAAREVMLGIDPPLARDPWRRSAYPRLWQLLTDAERGVPTTGPAPRLEPRPPAKAPDLPTDAFAPPGGADDVVIPERRRREVGAVPAEWLALDAYRPPWQRALLLVLGGLLAAVALLAAPLLALSASVGQEDPALLATELALVVAALVVAGALGIGAVEGRRAPARPAIRLADGRILSRRFWAGGVVPLLTSTLTLPAVPVAFWAYDVEGAAWSVVLLVLAPIFGVALAGRVRAIRLVRAVHDRQPVDAVTIARQATSGRLSLGGVGARVWLGLALLWDGQADAAERELDASTQLLPDVRELLAWFRAGRGEIELDHLLRRPEPEQLGPEYRLAVTCAIAALRAGRPERVLGRVERWATVADQLPNRFGALLHHLVWAVLARADDPRATAYRSAHPEIGEASWVARVWPFAA